MSDFKFKPGDRVVKMNEGMILLWWGKRPRGGTVFKQPQDTNGLYLYRVKVDGKMKGKEYEFWNESEMSNENLWTKFPI